MKRTAIKTKVHAPSATSKISMAVQSVAYRTAQEALTNIVKHAGCTHVTIDLSDSEDVLTLEIRDDGKGIAPGETSKPRAFGLRGLHERAKTVGGWLDISSRPGCGTSIILSVPLLPSKSPIKL
jgi:signal transduction histidine kinase